MFRALQVFLSASSWVLRKMFMELVLLTLENCTLYSGQDQRHVAIIENKVDT